MLLTRKLSGFLSKLHVNPLPIKHLRLLCIQHLDVVPALHESHSFPEVLSPFNSKVNTNKWIYDRYRRAILLHEAGDSVLLSLFVREATYLGQVSWNRLL